MQFLLLQSLFPFLLIASFLSINVELSLCQNDQQFTNCSSELNCGSVGGISYPFWGENRASYCGQPGFEIQCLDNVPVFNMKGVSYRILQMNTTTNSWTVKVARNDYWGSICNPTFVNTTLNFSLFDYVSTYTNMTFYYQCPTTITLPNIQSCNTSSVFYLTRSMTSVNCTYEVIVPVYTTAALAIEAGQTTRITDAVDGGFSLQLQIDNDQCDKCLGSGGQCGFNTSTNSGFSCFCADQAYASTCYGTSNSRDKQLKLKLGLVGAAFVVVVLVVVCCFFWNKRIQKHQIVEAFLRSHGPLEVQRHSYSEVKKMTNSFKEKLGQGGYGAVYKGKLKDGRLVAVKVLTKLKGDGEEFINEVAAISRTSHVNIVSLLGYCFECSKRALIYEFMPNGSLEKFIFNASNPKNDHHHLGWETLDQISLGIARGLEYLHRGCNTRILHFDIKPHNILLNEKFTPKISDFGLAKICNRNESIVSMLGARGTAGYIAPELFSRNFGKVSHKSDVYSYGMMLSEIVGGRRNIDTEVENTSEIYFPHWIYQRLKRDEELGLQSVTNEEDKVRARKMIIVSLWCIQTDPSNRPAMKEVIDMLEGSVDSLQIPPKPYLSSPPKSPADSSTTLVSIQ
ncbi:receptor-like protein kinase [Pyrus ussuriensis x Pyrus communis]|uniref:non-specific serine/threonine protein kinase n=1 Tax=Pyrus ussuriensis x Pyrus communis TaxID=2448454 RepID=A0A5N5G918_9ROSA|nr:receptor-like protein kinase [Pyrus ussuriensis x Pyrus communis]